MHIEAKNISKVIKKKNILTNVGISLKKDKVYGLLGPNGAGKTSLFSILSGLNQPSQGEIYFDSKKVNELNFEARSKLGIIYLPQEPSVFRELTVKQNILAALEARNYKKIDNVNLLEKISLEFNLKKILSQKCNTLSGGQRRRVEIARAIALKPKLILLDEPFAGIDPLVINEIKDLIRNLKSKGIGILLSDHNVKATLDICDHIYVINSGEMIASGTPEQIIKNELVKEVYLGDVYS
ncbi:MAG: LPS export ABC transporter ATP-binding protein [Gammaproteobacteria bacterium TMED159]|nr:MAG: LPS export ABC transporter ATP-binding protein [Gammaproteobacteria bacterium TMED159]|tara:strand:+ start:5198 stop:5914 length:717 start_codon:yes stop_codon:yes gene_type:complete